MAEPSEILGRFVRALSQFENAAGTLSRVTRDCNADRTQISGKKGLSLAERQEAIDQINDRFHKAFDEMCDAGMSVQELLPEALDVIGLPAGLTRIEYGKQLLTLLDCLVNESEIDVRDVAGGDETGSHASSEDGAKTSSARGTGPKRGTAIRGRNARSHGATLPSTGRSKLVPFIPPTNSLEQLRKIRQDLTLQFRLMGQKVQQSETEELGIGEEKMLPVEPEPNGNGNKLSEGDGADKRFADIDLDGTGELIVDTLGRNGIDAVQKRLHGEAIAIMAKARFNTHFKSTLSHLRQLRVLANPGRGYYLDILGQTLYRKRQERAKGQDKVGQEEGLG